MPKRAAITVENMSIPSGFCVYLRVIVGEATTCDHNVILGDRMATPKTRTTTKSLTVVNVRLMPATLQALTKLAAADRRSLSQYVRLVLENHVAAQKPA
jgi:hypothetical protein